MEFAGSGWREEGRGGLVRMEREGRWKGAWWRCFGGWER